MNVTAKSIFAGQNYIFSNTLPVVTLTSDLGSGSHYIAILRARLLARDPQLMVVDISHEIQPFNLVETAFLLNDTWHHFPPGTIHIIAVDTATAEHKRHLMAEIEGHYFIAADNGILSLLAENREAKYFEIRKELVDNHLFEASNIYIPLAAALAAGDDMMYLVDETQELKQLSSHQAVIVDSAIIGNVIFVDRFQNVFTNVSRKAFEDFVGDERFSIRLGRHERIMSISRHYSDVPPGEKLALFGDNNLLQISINKGGLRGGAAQLLGLQVGSKFMIEKDDRQNSKNVI